VATKALTLVEIRQSYCNENRVQFFAPTSFIWYHWII